MLKLATFGGGCFWGMQKAFQKKFPTATSVKVGYCGGKDQKTSYNAVCGGNTGHAEVVQIEFNPNKISYDSLVDFFFRMHDPTTLNRQGNDRYHL